MIGNPKYNKGDIVRFQADVIHTGVICIIDRYGTFADDSDVSYDIFDEAGNLFAKHIREDYVIEKIGEVDDIDEVLKKL